jgi:carboxymethylenebutenolidase
LKQLLLTVQIKDTDMYADITKPPAPLPSPDLQKLAHGIALLPPLSRRGTGPGLILLTTPEATDDSITITDKSPSPLVKWAEEGYAVVQIPDSVLEFVSAEDALKEAVKGLDSCAKCEPKDKVGLVGESPGTGDGTVADVSDQCTRQASGKA